MSQSGSSGNTATPEDPPAATRTPAATPDPPPRTSLSPAPVTPLQRLTMADHNPLYKDTAFVPKLGKGGENFQQWKIMFEQLARSIGLWSTILIDMRPVETTPNVNNYDVKTRAGREAFLAAEKDYSDWDLHDSKLRGVILRTAPDDLSVQLQTKPSAKDMFEYICERYAADGPSQLAIVIENFVTLRWDGRADLTRFLDKWSAANTACEALKVEWPKPALITFLLIAIDKNTGGNDRFHEWAEYTRRQVGSQESLNKIEVNHLIRELNDRYAGKKHDQHSHVNYTNRGGASKANNKNNRHRSPSSRPSKKNPDGMSCHVCESDYHMSRNCPHLHPNQARSANFKPNPKLVDAYKKRAEQRRKERDNSAGKEDKKDKPKTFSMASTDFMCVSAMMPKSTWIVDTGASDHFTNDRSAFIEFEEKHGEIGCGGGPVHYEGIGRIQLIMYTRNDDRVSITFSNVLYTPFLPISTISPGQMKRFNVYWEGRPEALQDAAGKDVVYAPLHDTYKLNVIDVVAVGYPAKSMLMAVNSTANGHEDGETAPETTAQVARESSTVSKATVRVAREPPTVEIHRPRVTELSDDEDSALTLVDSTPAVEDSTPAVKDSSAAVQDTKPTPVDINILHRRLGHAWWEICCSYAKAHGMKPTGTEQDCETCLLTKSERAPGHQPQRREEEPLACLHGDTQEIKPYGREGERYILCLTDDATGRRWAAAVKRKSDIYDELQGHMEFCLQHYRRYPKRIRLDMGREFAPKRFKAYCRDKGILFEPSSEYYPEQNGKAEKANHILQSRMRAMVRDAKAPLFLWSEALPTAVKLLNATPTRLNKMRSPNDVFFERLDLPALKHTTAHYQVWGSVAYVNIPKQKRVRAEKLADTAIKGRLVGYEGNRIYRVFVAPNNVIRSPAVKVLEGVFEDDTAISHDELEEMLCFERGDLAPNNAVADEPIVDELHGPGNQGVLPVEPEQLPVHLPQSAVHSPQPAVDSELPAVDAGDDSIFEDAPELPALGAPEPAPPRFAVPDLPPRRSGRTTRAPQRLINELGQQADLTRKSANLAALCTLNYCFAAAMGFATPIKDLPPVPRSWKQMLNHPLHQQFQKATEFEMAQHDNNGTYRKVRKPAKDSLLLPVKWIWNYKADANGLLASFKARLVVRGDKQRPGLDYLQTYAATVRPSTLKLLLALAAIHGWIIHQDDVLTAFLNGKMDRPNVYIKLPEGYREYDKDGTEMVGELQKALYGLKQAPLLWNKEFTDHMKSVGYMPIEADPCVFKTPHEGYLVIYVDDLLYIHAKIEGVNRMKADVRARYETRDLGELKHYLGMRVKREAQKIFISQDSYIVSMMHTYNVVGTKEIPLPVKEKIVPNDGEFNPERTARYQSIVGSIGYAANMTRPDIAFAAHKLCQFSHNPSPRHLELAEHLLQYLNGHRNYAVCLGGDELNLHGYSDAAHADNKDRRSTAGYVFKAAGGVISYKSHKQTVIATSTAYAEYIALASAAKEAIWLDKLVTQLRYNSTPALLQQTRPITILGDNNSSLAIANADRNSNRTKHFDIVYHYTRECVDSGQIKVQYVPTKDMVADGLTKALEPAKFKAFVQQLGLVPLPQD